MDFGHGAAERSRIGVVGRSVRATEGGQIADGDAGKGALLGAGRVLALIQQTGGQIRAA